MVPLTPLFSSVPLYPVLGNHEMNSDFFFQYFDLPKNGTQGFEEHWWYKDNSNVRIIGLNSNSAYRIQKQLDWLDNVLYLTSIDNSIDFVFAQLHHPHKSEQWTPGNTDFTGEIVKLLEEFTSRAVSHLCIFMVIHMDILEGNPKIILILWLMLLHLEDI